MSTADQRFVERFYQSAPESKDEDSKRLVLFKLIAEGETEAEACCKIIYGDSRHFQAFKKLSQRLKKDLINFKLLKSSRDNEDEQSYQSKEITCRKLLLQGDQLLKEGASGVGQKLLQKAYKMAVKHELLAEAVIAADILRTHIGYKKGLKAYEEYTVKIQEHLSTYLKVNEAKEINYRILLPHIFHKNLGQEYLAFADEARKNMKRSFEETNSPNIGYVYYLTNLYYADLVNDLDFSLKNANAFLAHISDHPAIYSNNRIGNARIQLANILINKKQFELAADHARSAVGLFKDSGNNQLLALELLFLAQLHLGKVAASGETVQRVRSDTRTKRSLFAMAKWAYFESAVCFKEGRFEASIEALQQASAILKDKSGWLFGHKLLEIMNLVELGQIDLVEFRVEALRKLLQRQRNSNVLRIKQIFQLLSFLVKREFNFSAIGSAQQDWIDALRSEEEAYFWDPTGFELIRFDNWIELKKAA